MATEPARTVKEYREMMRKLLNEETNSHGNTNEASQPFPDLAWHVKEAKQLTLSEVPFMLITHGEYGLVLEKHGDGIFVLLATVRPPDLQEVYRSATDREIAHAIYRDYNGAIVVDEILMQAVATGEGNEIVMQPTTEAYPIIRLGENQLQSYQRNIDKYLKPSDEYGGISLIEHIIVNGDMIRPTPIEAGNILTRRHTA